MGNPIERTREGSGGSPIEELQSELRIVDTINDEMGNVGNKNIGLSKARLEGFMRLMGFKDSDDVRDEFVDVGRQRGGNFVAVTRFDSRKNGFGHC